LGDKNKRFLSQIKLLTSYNFYDRLDTQINQNLHAAATYKTATAIAAPCVSAIKLASQRDVE